ncbi:MAG TPA: hypothetical protein VK750_07675 [Cytophagaceae bacterium]|jgi:hypothetical protein|nr:hypothetical protein [Cytophagaceae bacterium]
MKQVFKFSIILVAMLSCSREKADFIGPGYIDAPEGFAVTTPLACSPKPINFTSGLGTVTWTAAFNNTVTWTLTLTGRTSGAVHQVTGTSNSLNHVWRGSNDGVFFFRTGETVVGTVSFLNTAVTSSDSLTITQAADFSSCSQYVPIYNSFTTQSSLYTYWNPYNSPPIPNESQGVDSAAVDYKGNLVNPVEGKYYYYIKGLGNASSFVSGIQYIKNIPFNTLPADPNRVWVNVFLYGTGDPNAGLDLECQEADAPDTKYVSSRDDAFVAHLTLNHVGWKLFSIKYADLVQSTNLGFGNNGNGIREPNRLRVFDFILLKKNNPNSPVEVYIDYPVFTVDGPFKTCK